MVEVENGLTISVPQFIKEGDLINDHDIALHNTTKKGEVFKIRAVRSGGSACSALEITDEARQFMRKCVYHAL